MKHIILLLALLLSSGFCINAQNVNVDSVFSSANKAYSEQDFLTSIDLYNQIINSGYKSPELFLNAGNAYFKIGQYSKAILNYEKASLLDPSDEDIRFNLQKANAYTIDKIEMIPEFFLVGWTRSFISILDSNKWALIALFSILISLILFFLFFIYSSRSKKVFSFSFGIILLAIALLSYTFAVKTRNYIENSDQGIVMTSTVTVKGAPDADGINVFIIHEGTKVQMLRSIGDWYEIKLADGKQGWLLNSDIAKI